MCRKVLGGPYEGVQGCSWLGMRLWEMELDDASLSRSHHTALVIHWSEYQDLLRDRASLSSISRSCEYGLIAGAINQEIAHSERRTRHPIDVRNQVRGCSPRHIVRPVSCPVLPSHRHL